MCFDDVQYDVKQISFFPECKAERPGHVKQISLFNNSNKNNAKTQLERPGTYLERFVVKNCEEIGY